MRGRFVSAMLVACVLSALPLALRSAHAEAADADARAGAGESAGPRKEALLLAAVVEQPRPFGYVLGDLLTQRVLLEAGGREVEPAEIPAAGRVGIWFERRSARVERRPDGRRWLSVEYQVINAPQALRSIRLPAWDLKTAPPATTLRVAEWPITVGPLTRASTDSANNGTDSVSASESGAAGTFIQLRPDRAAPIVPTAHLRRSVTLWSGALALTLAVWLAWLLWRNHIEAASLPFARAHGEIRHTEDNSPKAWQSLHHAFDQTAGRVVQLQSLPTLFASAPHLAPLRPRIETFYSQSSDRFFGGSPPSQPVSARALCSDLRRLEKRYQR